jgi:hypothetical protein
VEGKRPSANPGTRKPASCVGARGHARGSAIGASLRARLDRATRGSGSRARAAASQCEKRDIGSRARAPARVEGRAKGEGLFESGIPARPGRCRFAPPAGAFARSARSRARVPPRFPRPGSGARASPREPRPGTHRAPRARWPRTGGYRWAGRGSSGGSSCLFALCATPTRFGEITLRANFPATGALPRSAPSGASSSGADPRGARLSFAGRPRASPGVADAPVLCAARDHPRGAILAEIWVGTRR